MQWYVHQTLKRGVKAAQKFSGYHLRCPQKGRKTLFSVFNYKWSHPPIRLHFTVHRQKFAAEKLFKFACVQYSKKHIFRLFNSENS